MFKNTKDFKFVMYNILSDVNEGISLNEIKEKCDIQEFEDALEECYNRKYILGLNFVQKNVKGSSLFVPQDNVRLSYSGLDFIEKFKTE